MRRLHCFAFCPLGTPLRQRLLVLATAALLAACQEQVLYSDLTERQANEVVAALRENGIAAQKVKEEKAYAVQVGADDFPGAVQLMRAQGLPRESYDTLGQVFKREGFVSTPLEERARLLYALSQELSSTVSSIDGVVSARVHLVVPEKHPLDDHPQPAAASVFIKHRPDADLAALTPKIRALIINSVEGLPAEKVTVAMFAAQPPAAAASGTFQRAEPAPMRAGSWLPFSLALGGATMVGAAWLVRTRRARPSTAAQEPALIVREETSRG